MGIVDKAKQIADIIDPSSEVLAQRARDKALAEGATPEEAEAAAEKAAKGADGGGFAAAAAS